VQNLENMAYIETEVHIDVSDHLHEVDNEDLISELESRGVGDAKSKIVQLNLLDQIRYDEFMSVFKNIPQSDFDEFINKYK
jgi:biopolymer transport protein ExbD